MTGIHSPHDHEFQEEAGAGTPPAPERTVAMHAAGINADVDAIVGPAMNSSEGFHGALDAVQRSNASVRHQPSQFAGDMASPDAFTLPTTSVVSKSSRPFLTAPSGESVSAMCEGAAIGYAAPLVATGAASGIAAGVGGALTLAGAPEAGMAIAGVGTLGGVLTAASAAPLAVGAGVGALVDRGNPLRGAAIGSVAGSVGFSALTGGVTATGLAATGGLLAVGAGLGYIAKNVGDSVAKHTRQRPGGATRKMWLGVTAPWQLFKYHALGWGKA